MSARWVRNNSAAVVAKMRAAQVAALADGAEFMLEESNRTIPIEEATLAGSGTTSVDVVARKAAFSWDTPYAIRQHEEMTWRHDEGRRAKWAEQTIKEQSSTIVAFLGRRMRAVLR